MFVHFPPCVPLGLAAGVFYGAFILSVGGPTLGQAQIPQSQREQLVALSEAAREALDPQRFPSDEQAKAQVLSAVDGVVAYLAPRTDPQNLADWLSYIDADPLVDAIRSEAPAEEIANQARRVRNRLIGNIAGLELAALRQLRRSSEQLLTSLRFEDRDAAMRLVDQQLQSLSRRLESADLASPEDAAALSTIVGLLYQSNQAPELVSSVRSAYSRPNLIISIGGHVIEQAITRPVGQARPIRDCILGTTVIGKGALTGEVVGRLAPCHGRVQVDLILTGQFNSNTVGYNGPVRLPTVGHGHVTASRSLWINETERNLSPTTASAVLKSTITSIDHPWRIVRKIAAKQIAQKQPQAEAIATGRLRTQVANDFDRQTAQAVSGVGAGPLSLASGGLQPGADDPLKQIRTTLARLDLSAPVRTVGSTRQNVYLLATQQGATQLAASNSPPPLANLLQSSQQGSDAGQRQPAGSAATALSYDAAIQVHESVVDNVAGRLLAGRTVSGRQIDRLLAFGGRPPADSKESPEEQEPFEIDFSNFRPIILELRDQNVRLGLRGTRFSQGNRELVRPLEITAVYEPQRVEDGTMILSRIGDVSVDFPGTRRLTVQQVVLRRTIQVLFAERFPERLLDRPTHDPNCGERSLSPVRTFRTDFIDAQNGWISVTIKDTPLKLANPIRNLLELTTLF
jgi:hypothetical protein